MVSFAALAVACFIFFGEHVDAFRVLSPTRNRVVNRRVSLFSSSGTEKEIAELEKRLAELKSAAAENKPTALDMMKDKEKYGDIAFIDVRSADEIAAPPYLPSNYKVAAAPVILNDASAMTSDFLESNGIRVDTSIVVYCMSGRRASVAITALQALGCTKVVNGGGINDVVLALNEANPPQDQQTTPENGAGASVKFDPSTLSTRQKVANIKNMPASSELVTESWKEEEIDSEGGGAVTPIISGVVAAIFLAIFSQVPAGNDVSIGLPANEMRRASPEEIRARYEGLQ